MNISQKQMMRCQSLLGFRGDAPREVVKEIEREYDRAEAANEAMQIWRIRERLIPPRRTP